MAAVHPWSAYPCFKMDACGDLLLGLQVVPGASRSRIEGLHGEGGEQRLRLRLQAPPVDGQANAALLRLLAHVLDVPARQLKIDRGQGSRLKQVRIAAEAVPGIHWAALQEALQR